MHDPVEHLPDKGPTIGLARNRSHVTAGQERCNAPAATAGVVGIWAERWKEYPGQLRADMQSQSKEHRQQVAVGRLLRDPARIEQQFPQKIVQWAGGIQR